MNDQLFVPEKIKVGYQQRNDTYTKKLGFVVIIDENGNIRQPKAWEGWRDKKIEPNEYENLPIEGFVVNKDVGGVRRSYSSYGRMEKVRIYDPRDFEIEITVENLLFILQESNSIKGKGLEGKFIYGWANKSLALLPVDSEEYKNSVEFTKLQSGKITKKSMVAGCTYRTKTQSDLIYLGYFDYYDWVPYKEENFRMVKSGYYEYKECDHYGGHVVNKRFIFIDVETQKMCALKDIKSLAKVINDVPINNLAELLDDYYKSAYGSKPISITNEPRSEIIFDKRYSHSEYEEVKYGYYVRKINENEYIQYNIDIQFDYKEFDQVSGKWLSIFKGYQVIPKTIIKIRNNNEVVTDSYESKISNEHKNVFYTSEEIKAMKFDDLIFNLESGSKFSYYNYANRYFL